jgi:hypothetical protein
MPKFTLKDVPDSILKKLKISQRYGVTYDDRKGCYLMEYKAEVWGDKLEKINANTEGGFLLYDLHANKVISVLYPLLEAKKQAKKDSKHELAEKLDALMVNVSDLYFQEYELMQAHFEITDRRIESKEKVKALSAFFFAPEKYADAASIFSKDGFFGHSPDEDEGAINRLSMWELGEGCSKRYATFDVLKSYHADIDERGEIVSPNILSVNPQEVYDLYHMYLDDLTRENTQELAYFVMKKMYDLIRVRTALFLSYKGEQESTSSVKPRMEWFDKNGNPSQHFKRFSYQMLSWTLIQPFLKRELRSDLRLPKRRLDKVILTERESQDYLRSIPFARMVVDSDETDDAKKEILRNLVLMHEEDLNTNTGIQDFLADAGAKYEGLDRFIGSVSFYRADDPIQKSVNHRLMKEWLDIIYSSYKTGHPIRLDRKYNLFLISERFKEFFSKNVEVSKDTFEHSPDIRKKYKKLMKNIATLIPNASMNDMHLILAQLNELNKFLIREPRVGKRTVQLQEDRPSGHIPNAEYEYDNIDTRTPPKNPAILRERQVLGGLIKSLSFRKSDRRTMSHHLAGSFANFELLVDSIARRHTEHIPLPPLHESARQRPRPRDGGGVH